MRLDGGDLEFGLGFGFGFGVERSKALPVGQLGLTQFGRLTERARVERGRARRRAARALSAARSVRRGGNRAEPER
jgi:hypothetical protein